jgi:nucleoside-diphosphate-sugar epimerase
MSSIKRIGIIGLGWLGAPLAQHLSKQSHTVWGTIRSNEKAKDLSMDRALEVCVWSHIDGSQSLKDKLASTDVLIITLPPNKLEGNSYSETIEHLLELCSEDCRFIYTSSVGIYPAKAGEYNEDTEVDFSSPLYSAEQVFRQKAPEASAILRLGGLIGGKRHPVHFLVKKTNSDPLGRVHLIQRDDIIQIIGKIIENERFGKTWNLISPEVWSREEYYNAVAQNLGLPKVKFSEERTYVTDRKIISNKLAELEFENFTPLLKTI